MEREVSDEQAVRPGIEAVDIKQTVIVGALEKRRHRGENRGTRTREFERRVGDTKVVVPWRRLEERLSEVGQVQYFWKEVDRRRGLVGVIGHPLTKRCCRSLAGFGEARTVVSCQEDRRYGEIEHHTHQVVVQRAEHSADAAGDSRINVGHCVTLNSPSVQRDGVRRATSLTLVMRRGFNLTPAWPRLGYGPGCKAD